MVINQKDKGTNFERLVVDKLNKDLDNGTFKRVAGSGALGTNLHEPLLMGDVVGAVKGLYTTVRGECKVGYGGETQLALKREWLNKINEEASKTYSIPVLFGKFSGARKSDGVQMFAVLDINVFINLLNYITKLSDELDKLYEQDKKI